MSIKKLFGKNSNNSVLVSASLNTLGSGSESPEYIESQILDKQRFIPHVDFSKPENFAKYGSAKKYYIDSFERIRNQYPYDGSLKEKNEWHLSSSFLDKYIFDKRFPRTTGHVIFSADNWDKDGNPANSTYTLSSSKPVSPAYGAPKSGSYEYITIVGGPNKSKSTSSKIRDKFSGSNLVKIDEDRGSNLKLDPAVGATVEFWLKKPNFPQSNGTYLTEKEVIFDLWNGEDIEGSGDDESDQTGYGRFIIELSASETNLSSGQGESPFRITLRSGSYGITDQRIGSTSVTTASVAASTWKHYAVSVKNSDTSGLINVRLYVNGILDESQEFQVTDKAGNDAAEVITEVTGPIIGYIGALQASPSGSFADSRQPGEGWGKLSASMDEFRYWKKERTPEEVGRNWFTNVHGGSNTDSANKHLGVYYKFNEGITGTSSVDSIVLDYSGRVSNGDWTGYGGSSSRSIDSAIVIASASVSEFKEPILYGFHSDVKALEEELIFSGSTYDYQNNAGMFHSLPAWIIEEDELVGGDTALKLTQIVSSYLDTLHLQIEALPSIKDVTYSSGSHKPMPFSNRMLENFGFIAPDIFVDATVLEELTSRSETKAFEEKIFDIKNFIYENIYNNLSYIYKSKGTEKSIRNLIRCFGVDDELIRLNMYSDNTTFELKDNIRETVTRKKYIDFNHPDRFSSTVYQMTSSARSDSVSYISGSGDLGYEDSMPITIEAEAIIPYKKFAAVVPSGSFPTPFTTSSVFGMHQAQEAAATLTWATNDYSNFQVFAIRTEAESKDIYFALSSSYMSASTANGTTDGLFLTSSVFTDAYDNEKWNFAVRIKPEKHPWPDFANDTTDGNYDVEFLGYNSDANTIKNEFSLSASISNLQGKNVLRNHKRLYLGAHRTNFTGPELQKSDLKISSLRYWMNYLENDVIKAHARDPQNFGTLNPSRNAFVNKSSVEGYIPEIETLALHWDFSNITTSDSGSSASALAAEAGFDVSDASSGSSGLLSRYSSGKAVAPAGGAAAATITIVDSSAVPGVPYIGAGDTIQLISTDGTTVTLTMQGTGGSTTSGATSGTTLTAKTLASGSYADSSLQATAQAVEIRTAINHHTKFSATNSSNIITVTQAVAREPLAMATQSRLQNWAPPACQTLISPEARLQQLIGLEKSLKTNTPDEETCSYLIIQTL
jgi:hypothetical protein